MPSSFYVQEPRVESILQVTVSTGDQGVMWISFATARPNLLFAAGIMWRRQDVWKMEYRDVERSSIYTQPLVQNLAFPGRNRRRPKDGR